MTETFTPLCLLDPSRDCHPTCNLYQTAIKDLQTKADIMQTTPEEIAQKSRADFLSKTPQQQADYRFQMIRGLALFAPVERYCEEFKNSQEK